MTTSCVFAKWWGKKWSWNKTKAHAHVWLSEWLKFNNPHSTTYTLHACSVNGQLCRLNCKESHFSPKFWRSVNNSLVASHVYVHTSSPSFDRLKIKGFHAEHLRWRPKLTRTRRNNNPSGTEQQIGVRKSMYTIPCVVQSTDVYKYLSGRGWWVGV